MTHGCTRMDSDTEGSADFSPLQSPFFPVVSVAGALCSAWMRRGGLKSAFPIHVHRCESVVSPLFQL